MDEQDLPYQVVIGQSVTQAKHLAAKSMRRNMTDAEKVFWAEVRRNGLLGFHFRRQQIIDGFIADFYCHAGALVVEVDGPTHDPDYDRERDEVFRNRGITVLRFGNDDVLRSIDGVLEAIAGYLDGRNT